MNIKTYRNFIANKAREEITKGLHCDLMIRHRGNRFLFHFGYLSSRGSWEEIEGLKSRILNWLGQNKHIFDNIEIEEWTIYAELINTEEYEKVTQEENSTKYDNEIEQLRKRLAELEKLQKEEQKNKKKNAKIEQLEKQLRELRGEPEMKRCTKKI